MFQLLLPSGSPPTEAHRVDTDNGLERISQVDAPLLSAQEIFVSFIKI